VTRVSWIFLTLISHWRRHPLNFATLFIGLAIATALWSGVQALNAQARASYDRAADVLGNTAHSSIVPARGAFASQTDYVTLRRAGWKVSPVLEGTVRVGGAAYRLVGIEPLTAPQGSSVSALRSSADLEAFLRAPGRMLVAPETLIELGGDGTKSIRTDRGETLPPLVRADALGPGLLVVDIGIAQQVLARPGQLTRLVFGSEMPVDANALSAITDGRLKIEQATAGGDLARLTDSFHLNLTAFGLLAFIVGLFIANASIGLAFEQRLGMLRTMRAIGVSLVDLISVMVLEVVLIALIAGAFGMAAGYFIAASLLPNVAATLDGLYGAHVSGTLGIDARWWVSGLGMALIGALAASAASLVKVANMPLLSVAKPIAWREAQQTQLRRQVAIACLSLLLALLAYFIGRGLVAGFAVIAGVLIGAALLLPPLLALVLRLGERTARSVLSEWFWADARQQLSGLSLALMALLLALSANVGVGTMVEGFRKTFTGWLDERLNSEVYFDTVGAAEAERVVAWLEKRREVRAILPVWRAETRIESWPVELVGMRDHETYRVHFSLLSSARDAWDRMRDGEGVLISEQFAQRMGTRVGDRIAIPTYNDVWSVPVVGIFPDYGNPKGQIRMDVDQLVRHWTDARRVAFSLRVAPDAAAALIEAMHSEFGPALARVVDQASLKAASTRIFERTFAVTAALNSLTLVVSGVALFASLLTLSGMRLAQLAPVWALGVQRRQLGQLEVGKLAVLAVMTAILAIPLGLVLAWCLVAIVNVQAFGWRLPFHVFPEQWAVVVVLALVTALIASIIPVARLARTAPHELLKVFANER
jgi:putative ABC transport system permease protein